MHRTENPTNLVRVQEVPQNGKLLYVSSMLRFGRFRSGANLQFTAINMGVTDMLGIASWLTKISWEYLGSSPNISTSLK